MFACRRAVQQLVGEKEGQSLLFGGTSADVCGRGYSQIETVSVRCFSHKGTVSVSVSFNSKKLYL